MRILTRILKVLAILVLAVALLAAGGGYLFVRRSFPATGRTRVARALRILVRVRISLPPGMWTGLSRPSSEGLKSPSYFLPSRPRSGVQR